MIWKGDILIADVDTDLDKVGCNQIALTITGSIESEQKRWWDFPVADGYSKIVRQRLLISENPLWGENRPWCERRSRRREWQGESGESQLRQNRQMTYEARADLWSVQGDFIKPSSWWTSSSTLLAEERNIRLFHWSTLRTDKDLLELLWISWGGELTVTGMSIDAKICQILGEDSENSLY